MRFIYFIILCLFFSHLDAQSASKSLNYYLPDIQYDKNIPTPAQVLGFQVGDWHVSHDQLITYFKALDAASDRIELMEYARSYEHRPLLIAMISDPAHLKNKENIKKQHADLANSSSAPSVDIKSLPAILWQGYTIHGNEPSGNNAALLVAYYLVAGQSKDVLDILANTFILLDPCLNPDGAQRFATWVNSHKSHTLVSDPVSREFAETWPGGRYNHYWFDMNRDWLLLIHPESRGRIKLMHEWHPNVVTDHHEMGTNNTFFFQPGIPSSNNPNTPAKNFELTEAIGKFHAKALDSIGSLYYTKFSFDDFYYGKGSTYPDAIGAMGILFEQASSRGHLQESVNGLLSFPFTIRNQVVTSLSTQKAVVALKSQILKYKQDFHTNVKANVKKEVIKGYVFTDKDPFKINKFIDVLLQHKVGIYKLHQDLTVNGQVFNKDKSYIVPLDQTQPILAKTIFEEVKNFQDSSFYDVSGWTMSHAYGLKSAPLMDVNISKNQKIASIPTLKGKLSGENENIYAYVIPSGQYLLHKTIYALQANGIKVKVNAADIDLSHDSSRLKLPKGSAIIPIQNQQLNEDEINILIQNIIENYAIEIYSIGSGNGTESMTLGHPLVTSIDKPSIAYIIGNGVSPQSAGEIWHHTDINLNLPATMIDNTRVRSTNLQRYNTLILPSGNYNNWSESENNKIKEWVQQGNTLIIIGNTISWAVDKKLISLSSRKYDKPTYSSGIYENADREADASMIGGSVLAIDIDQTHPLFYGIDQTKMYVMKDNNRFYNPTSNSFATPAKYSDECLASGYLPKGIETTIRGGANVTVHQSGNGRIICFHTDPLFRGYWLSGHTVFNNALFFDKIIDRRTMEIAE
jgi:hypothetical protein